MSQKQLHKTNDTTQVRETQKFVTSGLVALTRPPSLFCFPTFGLGLGLVKLPKIELRVLLFGVVWLKFVATTASKGNLCMSRRYCIL